MPKNQKRVLLALGWYDYRVHQGIEKYAQEHGWNLYADFAREKVIPWGWEGDGILAWLGAGGRGFGRRLLRPRLRLPSLIGLSADFPSPRVIFHSRGFFCSSSRAGFEISALAREIP